MNDCGTRILLAVVLSRVIHQVEMLTYGPSLVEVLAYVLAWGHTIFVMFTHTWICYGGNCGTGISEMPGSGSRIAMITFFSPLTIVFLVIKTKELQNEGKQQPLCHNHFY